MCLSSRMLRPRCSESFLLILGVQRCSFVLKPGCQLYTYPGSPQLLHYHGGAELINEKVKSFLL